MKSLLKQAIFASALLTATIMVSSTVYASTSSKSHQTQAKTQTKSSPQLLFVLSAQSGNINQSGHKQTLTLNNIEPHVLWFTDRPNRKAGFVSLTKFLGNWTKFFAKNPPNAAMVHVGMEAKVANKDVPMAMELSQPHYKNGTLTFQVSNLNGDVVNTGALQNVKVFFDDASLVRVCLSEGCISEWVNN